MLLNCVEYVTVISSCNAHLLHTLSSCSSPLWILLLLQAAHCCYLMGVCLLQAFFDFFNELNSYWVAPFVNLVFVLTAILTQLCLLFCSGSARSAFDMKLHGKKLTDQDTEHRRLLTTADLDGGQQMDDGTPRLYAYEGVMPADSPRALCIEMSDAHSLLHQRTNSQSHT